MAKLNHSYVELIDAAYAKEPLYLGFKETINDMSFSEANTLLTNMESLHKAYYKAMDKMEGYSFSESDYSFAGLMNFIKAVGNQAGKGIERHNAASAKLLDSLANPGKLGSQAYDVLSNMQSALENKYTQSQYKKMLNDADTDDEYGKMGNVAKLVKTLGKGWDRDRAARQKAGMWDQKDEDLYQKYKDKDEQNLERYRAAGKKQKEEDNIDYFLDEPAQEAATPAPAPAPAPSPSPEPAEDTSIPENLVTKGRGKRDKRQWQNPAGAVGKAFKGGLGRTGMYGEGEDSEYMENMDHMANYTESEETSYEENPRMKKAFEDKAKKTGEDSYKKMSKEYEGSKKDSGKTDRKSKSKKRMYDSMMDKYKKTGDKKYKNMAKNYSHAELVYSEAMKAGDKAFAKGMINAALKIVQKHEGLNFSEKNPTVRETLNKAVYYSFRENADNTQYAYPKTATVKTDNTNYAYPKPGGGEPSKFAPGKNGVVSDFGEEEGMEYMEHGTDKKGLDLYPETLPDHGKRLGHEGGENWSNDGSLDKGMSYEEAVEYMEKSGEDYMEKMKYMEQDKSYGDYADEAEGTGDIMQSPELQAMLETLSDDEKKQLCDALQASMGQEGGEEKKEEEEEEKPEAEEEKEEYKESCDDKYGEEEDESSYADGMESEGSYDGTDDTKKHHQKYFNMKGGAYSEKLRQEDHARQEFLQKCQMAYSEFDYVNEYYNVPLQFSEHTNYDFSEWVDTFRKANSASFNQFGNEVQFNGNLPKNIIVTKADEDTGAAWQVHDRQGKFVTLSGIPQFNELAFSEAFKGAYCKSTQGSTVKSDRVARAFFCGR